MAVSANDLKEYLRLPPDCLTVVGEATVDRSAFIEAVNSSGVYTFIKQDGGWTLNGSAVLLATYGITPGAEETEISVDYLTYTVDPYLNAAKSKARAAGVPVFENNAQYDLFILALAAMYYDNRGMTFDNTQNEQAAQNMINSFVLELRYAQEDPQ